jgi:hypothetical protein
MKHVRATNVTHLPFHTQNKKKFKDQEISKHAKKNADETPGKNGRLSVFYSLPRTALDTNEIWSHLLPCSGAGFCFDMLQNIFKIHLKEKELIKFSKHKVYFN